MAPKEAKHKFESPVNELKSQQGISAGACVAAILILLSYFGHGHISQ